MFLSLLRYRRDAALVSKYTGAELTMDQFRQYEKEFTVRQVMGSKRHIRNEFYGFGTTMEQSRVDISRRILNVLAQGGVVFNIEEGGGNEALFAKLAWGADILLKQGHWPRVPEAYKKSPRLIAAVIKSRQALGLNIPAEVM